MFCLFKGTMKRIMESLPTGTLVVPHLATMYALSQYFEDQVCCKILSYKKKLFICYIHM